MARSRFAAAVGAICAGEAPGPCEDKTAWRDAEAATSTGMIDLDCYVVPSGIVDCGEEGAVDVAERNSAIKTSGETTRDRIWSGGRRK